MAAILVCVPLLWPAVPPLTDVPGHIGRYRVMLVGSTLPLSQWYHFHWRLIGNLGVDLIVAALAPGLRLEPAVKLVTIAIPAIGVVGALWLSREVHGRISPAAPFALPLFYNQAFHTGFLNFSLAMGLSLSALALWLRLGRLQRLRLRAAIFVPLSVMLWAIHIFGWAVLGLVAFAAGLAERGHPVRAALACLPLIAPVPLILFGGVGGGGATHDFFNIYEKLTWFMMIFRDRWMIWDVLSFAVLLALFCTVLHPRQMETAETLRNGALALFAAFMILPYWLFGSALADTRLAAYAMMFAALSLRPKPTMNRRMAGLYAIVGLAFFVARIAGNTVSLAALDDRFTQELAAVDHLPAGSRVASLVSVSCDPIWKSARLDHIGGLALARRRVFSDEQWRNVGAPLMTINYPAARPFEADPSQLMRCPDHRTLARVISSIPRDAFDYLWLIDLPFMPPPTITGMTSIWHHERSALYRIEGPLPPKRPPLR